jgi:hypothetical protein
MQAITGRLTPWKKAWKRGVSNRRQCKLVARKRFGGYKGSAKRARTERRQSLIKNLMRRRGTVRKRM